MECAFKYFNKDILETYPFIRNVYNLDKYKNTIARRLYMFSDRHHFRDEDVEDLLVKYGVVLLPLFLPVSCSKFADQPAMADLVLTMYSPFLVGLWTRTLDNMNSRASPVQSTTRHVEPAYERVELHVQKDCPALRDFRQRVADRLCCLCDVENRPVFVQMSDSVVGNIERAGRLR